MEYGGDEECDNGCGPGGEFVVNYEREINVALGKVVHRHIPQPPVCCNVRCVPPGLVESSVREASTIRFDE